MVFKDRISLLRKEKGLSSTKLAYNMGKSEGAVRSWESGRSKPGVHDLICLASYFNCTTDYLLGLSDQRNEKIIPPASLNHTAKEVHQDAVDHGWWEEECSDGECIALMHCELSEVVEELRNGHARTEIYYSGNKPEGIPVELADTIIRILDYCGKHDIDLDQAIEAKTAYNKTRPYKHGGKKF